ncbi:hypothetical protein [Acetobacterium sp. MES1]|uniref:hypothetical protein n=1 Tax=Acetobacterium sp. MES1 TaxID=1899015 RepID=UPI00257F97BB|nr:hypothetical protein [Acetobacterium sp. MES1]
MASSIFMDFEGFADVQKKLLEETSEAELKKLNKKIIRAGQEQGAEIIKRSMPKSMDLEKSGPQRSGKPRKAPSDHAVDQIPIDNVKSTNGQTFGFIGWRPSDNEENFYAKFFEEGVDEHTTPYNYNRKVPRIPKLGLFNKANKEVATFINEIGLAEYSKKLEEVFGSDNQ